MAELANFDFAEGKDFDAVWHNPQFEFVHLPASDSEHNFFPFIALYFYNSPLESKSASRSKST